MSNNQKILLGLVGIFLIGTTLLITTIHHRIHTTLKTPDTIVTQELKPVQTQPDTNDANEVRMDFDSTAEPDTLHFPDLYETNKYVPLQRQQLSFKYNAQKIPLLNKEDPTMCPMDTKTHKESYCVRYTYQDKSSSVVLFEQDILRERMDFSPEGNLKQWTSWQPPNYSLAEWKIYSANGEERHSIYNLDGTLTNYSLRQDKRLLLGVMYFALLKDPKFFEIPSTFMISETEKTALVYILVPTALKTDNIIQYTKRRITLPDTDSLIDKVLGQIDDQNQIVLADGQKIPIRSSFKKAPSYCTLYPYDCSKP